MAAVVDVVLLSSVLVVVIHLVWLLVLLLFLVNRCSFSAVLLSPSLLLLLCVRYGEHGPKLDACSEFALSVWCPWC